MAVNSTQSSGQEAEVFIYSPSGSIIADAVITGTSLVSFFLRNESDYTNNIGTYSFNITSANTLSGDMQAYASNLLSEVQFYD